MDRQGDQGGTGERTRLSTLSKVLDGAEKTIDRFVFPRASPGALTSRVLSAALLVLLPLAFAIFVSTVAFISLSFRLRRFDPLVVVLLIWCLAPLLVLCWHRTIAYSLAVSFRQRIFVIPRQLQRALTACLLGLVVASVFIALVLGIQMGALWIFGLGLFVAALFYQWFFILKRPDTLNMQFAEASQGSDVFFFPDWVLLKAHVSYIFFVEAAILSLTVSAVVAIVDLVAVWTRPTMDLPAVYGRVIWHQALWGLALVGPLIAYTLLLGWVFVWETVKRFWIGFGKKHDDTNEQLNEQP